jgi:hypothetical protein
MIYYLVTSPHAYTLQWFLDSWGKALSGRVTIVTYEALFAGRPLPKDDATFIFSDLDRLSRPAREALGPYRERLVDACGAARVLNDPSRSLLRYDLLRMLHERGINRFDAWRAEDPPGDPPPRFPVFVRDERGSIPTAPSLVNSAAMYEAAVREAADRGVPREHIVAIEHCDTRDGHGIYRKYGAFVVGERVVPRHVFFSLRWHVKDADLVLPAMLAEESAYLDANPHAAALRDIFRLAGIEYGRVDYTVHDGRLQVWEINTNPVLAHPRDKSPLRRDVHRRFASAIDAAFAAIDTRSA